MSHIWNFFKAQVNDGARCEACGDGCVNAACLPQDVETGGKACWIAGWGTTVEGTLENPAPSATQLSSVGVNTISDQYCEEHTPRTETARYDSYRMK